MVETEVEVKLEGEGKKVLSRPFNSGVEVDKE